jgi:hypothetical protein
VKFAHNMVINVARIPSSCQVDASPSNICRINNRHRSNCCDALSSLPKHTVPFVLQLLDGMTAVSSHHPEVHSVMEAA